MRKRTYIPLDNSIEWDQEHENIPIPVCHNIVSTSQIECCSGWIDLHRVSLLLPNSRYDRKRFAAITIRIDNPTCTGLLFSSGKLVITGSVSMYACILAAHSISQLLRESDSSQNFRIVSCVVQNIVAHAEIPPNHKVDIDSFYRAYNEYATYQKSVFPGLVFRPPHSPIVLLIFASGKIVCTGGKSCQDILNGFRRLYPLIRPYIVSKRHIPRTHAEDGSSGSNASTSNKRQKRLKEQSDLIEHEIAEVLPDSP
jgi:transcription initiation factor TFIID TATA-box-binding protein